MPVARTAAQIEASRRNGARSKGPVTPEGKARASGNALTHGLCAMRHLVLEDEVPDHLEELITRMTEETGAVGEIETRLARRLAIAFWKGERAERIEVALFDAAPKTRMNGYRPEEADPLTTVDLRRFNAVRGQQGQIGREISRCLKELRLLRREALAQDRGGTEACAVHQRNYTNELSPGTDEPDSAWEKEPEPAAPANDDAAAAWESPAPAPDDGVQNEPEEPAAPDGPPDELAAYRAGLQQAIRAEMDALVELDEAEPDTKWLDELTYALCRSRLRAARG